jgi:DNA polymerase I-like protein with 3'-5' exonuclease and polymerase domains
VPVSVSIKRQGEPARSYAWGHLEGNNCTWGEARQALIDAYANPDGILCQNGKFDVDVAEVHMDLPVPPWTDVHDTMFLLFLDDPHQAELGLKPSAERLLGAAPDERDEVVEWLVANQPVPGVKVSKSKQSDHYAMKYLPYAPGDLVGTYANGDVDRTEDLFHLLYPKTVERGMLEAYERERRLMPILLRMERRGIPVDLGRLRADVRQLTEWRVKVDDWVIKKLKAPAGINLDSGDQVMAAMLAAGLVDESKALRTATGKFQTNKDALLVAVKDRTLLAMLRYRAALKTCLGTFMGPWLHMAEETGGKIHTTWNQVRSPKGDDTSGARTGRLSATWFMNMPKPFEKLWVHQKTAETKPDDAKKLVKCPIVGLPDLPECRSYIVPGDGRVLIDRDYSQQEPRILAHFDGGALMQSYLDDPWIDFHDSARDKLAAVGKHYERKPVKNTNLGLIYGMGVGKLAMKNDMTVNEAGDLKKAILTLYPGLKDMYKDMKLRARTNTPIRTWGGREIYCEEPRIVDGKLRQFDYKLVNMLIQGSAADCTKEAIIRFDAKCKDDWWLLLNVHDQLTASVPLYDTTEAMGVMRSCMESVEFDVPILSEGSISDTNWAELKDIDKKGKELSWPLKSRPGSSRSNRSLAGRSAGTATTSSARRRLSTSTSLS